MALDHGRTRRRPTGPASAGSSPARTACRHRAGARRSPGPGAVRRRARVARPPRRQARRRDGCAPRSMCPSPRGRTIRARTRAPRNASSAATISPAFRSPSRERDWLPRRRSYATDAPTRRDPDQLEQVAEPPPEIHERQRERPVQGNREKDEPHDHGEIGGAPREENVFAARRASPPKRSSPTASSSHAALERAAGTDGTRLGSRTPARLTPTIATTIIAWSAIRRGIEARALSARTPDRARTARPRVGAWLHLSARRRRSSRRAPRG